MDTFTLKLLKIEEEREEDLRRFCILWSFLYIIAECCLVDRLFRRVFNMKELNIPRYRMIIVLSVFKHDYFIYLFNFFILLNSLQKLHNFINNSLITLPFSDIFNTFVFISKKKRNELFQSTTYNKPSTNISNKKFWKKKKILLVKFWKNYFLPNFEDAIIKFLIYFPASKSSPKAILFRNGLKPYILFNCNWTGWQERTANSRRHHARPFVPIKMTAWPV